MFRNLKVRKSCCFCFPYNETEESSTEWLQPTGDEAKKRVSRSTGPGSVYIMTMEDCYGYSAPPFAKVGYSSNCNQRRYTLNIGNPHELTCYETFQVTHMRNAERAAHDELDNRGLRLDCDGGTEWFRYEDDTDDDLDDIDDFVQIVRNAIQNYLVQNEDSGGERDRGSSINHAPNQVAAKMASNYGHNNTKWRQDLKGNMLHVKYNCK